MFYVLPIDEATVYNELLELLYLEKNELKKLDTAGKTDRVADAALKFDITFDTITYDEGLKLMGPGAQSRTRTGLCEWDLRAAFGVAPPRGCVRLEAARRRTPRRTRARPLALVHDQPGRRARAAAGEHGLQRAPAAAAHLRRARDQPRPVRAARTQPPMPTKRVPMFAHYMSLAFGLERGPNPAKRDDGPNGRRRWRSSYLKLLQGWGLDSNGPGGRGAEGLGGEPLRPRALASTVRRWRASRRRPGWPTSSRRRASRYHNNSIFQQLDLLYEFCQWMLGALPRCSATRHARHAVARQHALRGAGGRRLAARAARCTVRLNNLVSFSTTRRCGAECFGDWVLEARMPAVRSCCSYPACSTPPRCTARPRCWRSAADCDVPRRGMTDVADTHGPCALGAYLGLALGDALGATVEFMTPREIAAPLRRAGRRAPAPHRRRLAASCAPGQVTDDTTMSLALGDALLRGERSRPTLRHAAHRRGVRSPGCAPASRWIAATPAGAASCASSQQGSVEAASPTTAMPATAR